MLSYFLNYWNLDCVHHNNIDHCLQSWTCLSKESNTDFWWKITLPHLWWGIWKERNNRIFRDKEMPDWVIGNNIIIAIKENFNSHRKFSDEFQINNPMQTKGFKIKIDDQRKNVKWKSPPMGWIKGNFDGTTKGNPSKAGCGGVLRVHTCRIVDVIAIPIGISTSHKAEAMTTLYTMGLAVETGHQNLWMEGDSLNIIDMLNNKSPITWPIEASLMEIKIQ